MEQLSSVAPQIRKSEGKKREKTENPILTVLQGSEEAYKGALIASGNVTETGEFTKEVKAHTVTLLYNLARLYEGDYAILLSSFPLLIQANRHARSYQSRGTVLVNRKRTSQLCRLLHAPWLY